ncbi:dTDP-glucose 4,6-dehydratase [Minicystis rosea]|nr:dTDP-glucose 4,6-dehydratase [Minicystis rosea]
MAGFIGSHLTERLLARGHEVTGLDNFDAFYDRKTKAANIALAGADRLIEGDILDVPLLDRILGASRYDAIVHLAALAGVSPSLKEPARYMRVNIEGAQNIADAAVRHGIKRVVFASSSSVYGANDKVPFHEDDRIDDPVSPYAASKRGAELALRAAVYTTGIDVAALRYFTVYGPRQRPDMAIHKFTRAIEQGEPVLLRGDGETSRDYTFIDDIIDGTVGAIERQRPGFRAYNLGGCRATKLGDLVAAIGTALGKTPRIEIVSEMRGDVQHTLADVTRAHEELGYDPKIGLEEGLRRFVEWYRSRR